MDKHTTYLITKFLMIVITLSLPTMASATEKHGGDIWYKDTKKFAPVIFSHDKHGGASNQCTDCHDKIFKKETGSADIGNAMTMRTMKRGKYSVPVMMGKKLSPSKDIAKNAMSNPERCRINRN